ncbi:MAG: DNA repair protein RadC [Cytophagales bacterium]|nr:MAG: DNA repair protein RadC [Cytophagales bacterium]
MNTTAFSKDLKPLKIQQWAEEDRPREKLLLKGNSALSDAELIAILIGSGTVAMSAVELAKLILNNCNNDLNQLAKLTINDLKKIKGIGEAKAITIISALELGRRRKALESSALPRINQSRDVYELMIPHLIDLPHEEFWVIYLNKANIVIQSKQMSKGGIAGTVVDQKLIFKLAIELMASSIVLVHNHPSGNRQPSHQDTDLTQKMKSTGNFLDVKVIDHIIFTNNSYFSYADEGLL